jgi:multiple sugar transport system ATP-binding protein
MATVRLHNISKTFADGTQAVHCFSLEVRDGEFVVLVGPSGCGKSTLLRMLAGLEEVSEGEISIDGQVVNRVPPQQRNTAMVFQNYALYPHKTVRQNLAFPLRMMKIEKQERNKRIAHVAEILGLSPWLDRRPKHLSGGQRQRVAMGRAMVRNPAVFLLDEPLSNLDAKLRVQVRAEIAQLQREMKTTTVYVTHDQVEAMTLGDRVAVLLDGRLQQIGSGQELYEQPRNVFVAGFIGNPGMNVFHKRLRRDDSDSLLVEFGPQPLEVSPQTIRRFGQVNQLLEQPILAGLRPEAFSIAQDEAAASSVTVRVTASEALGHEDIVYFESPARMYGNEQRMHDTESDKSAAASMVARLAARSQPPQTGDQVRLLIDTDKFVFFDQQGNRMQPK